MGKLIILPSDQGSYHGQEIIDGSTSLGENRPLSILLYKCAQARLCTQERSSFVQKKRLWSDPEPPWAQAGSKQLGKEHLTH